MLRTSRRMRPLGGKAKKSSPTTAAHINDIAFELVVLLGALHLCNPIRVTISVDIALGLVCA